MEGQQHQSKTRLLDATIKLVRTKGYTATRIEDVCAEAGVTKGSFFHHFKSKDDLALAALAHWKANSTDLFAHADYHLAPDPLDRVLAYVDLRKALLTGELADFTCFAGTMAQEMYATSPDIRAGCERSICGHAGTLEADFEAAMRQCHTAEDITASSLALHTQCVIQGAFVLAKATGRRDVAVDSIDHLRRYLELLLGSARSRPAAVGRDGGNRRGRNEHRQGKPT